MTKKCVSDIKVIDMHTHLGLGNPCGNIADGIQEAGIYGACIFSAPPKGYENFEGKDFEERLSEVLEFCEAVKGRLYPVLWISPFEEDILHKIDIAANRGIVAYKIICSGFYVYDEKCIAVLKHIASLNKPVFFHTGILWDGVDSSKYNRPANWEALINIKGLRFSMGHCSWPWIDECLAVYGKFLNAYGMHESAEMYLDITPGTPEIYRSELLTRLFTIGYDVGNNILFGTDSCADAYKPEWTKKWLETDRKIMDKLGVSAEVRENMYYNNLLRFLGMESGKTVHQSPEIDDANYWSPVCKEVPEIIEKWYRTLSFPAEYDSQFREAVQAISVSDAINIETYDCDEQDGKRNLLSFLYMCEQLKEKYDEKGIGHDILHATLQDLVIWTNTWSEIKHTLYLGELHWLKKHMSMQLFRLGRLQFCMGEAEQDIEWANVKKGDPVIEIHIPEAGPLNPEECQESIRMAEQFFATYFPEYPYKCFTCHSWLLDETLKEFLGEDSNIIQFQNLFQVLRNDKSDAILRYVFSWDTNRINLRRKPAVSSLAHKVKGAVGAGKSFYESFGILK